MGAPDAVQTLLSVDELRWRGCEESAADLLLTLHCLPASLQGPVGEAAYMLARSVKPQTLAAAHRGTGHRLRITPCYRSQALSLLIVGSNSRALALLARLGCKFRLSSAALTIKHVLSAPDLLHTVPAHHEGHPVQYCRSALPGR